MSYFWDHPKFEPIVVRTRADGSCALITIAQRAQTIKGASRHPIEIAGARGTLRGTIKVRPEWADAFLLGCATEMAAELRQHQRGGAALTGNQAEFCATVEAVAEFSEFINRVREQAELDHRDDLEKRLGFRPFQRREEPWFEVIWETPTKH